MAQLNPDAGGISSANMPDQTGASRGAIPDRSFGVLAEGLGQSLKIGADMYNDYNKYQIDQSIRTGFDSANKPYLDTIPGELAGSTSAMQQLQTAYEQGKISDVYYTGQLAQMSKKLRAQYPLYEDYVDAKIQDITGIRPANAYRNAVMDEFQKAEQNSKTEADKKLSYMLANEASLRRALPDAFDNPNNYSLTQMAAAVGEYDAQEKDIQRALSQFALMDAQGKVTKEDATSGATEYANKTVQSYLNGFNNVTLGFDTTTLFNKIIDAGKQGASPQEQQMMITQLGTLRDKIKVELQRKINAPVDPKDESSRSFATMIGNPDQVNKIIDQALAPINTMIEYATNKDYGMMTYFSRLTQLQQDQVRNKILNSSDNMMIFDTLSKIDPTLASEWMHQSAAQEGIIKELVPALMAGIITGKDTVPDTFKRIAESRTSAAEKAGGINALIDSNTATITGPNASPADKEAAIRATYGLDDQGKAIFSYINENEHYQLWQTMYSPDITKAVIDTANRDLIEMYTKSAIETSNNLPEFRNAAAAITETRDWAIAANVQVGSDGKLILSVDRSKIRPPGVAGASIWDVNIKNQIDKADKAVSAINSVFSQLGQLLDAENIPKEEQQKIFQQYLQNLSVDFTSAKQKDPVNNFFGWLADKAKAVTIEMQQDTGTKDLSKAPWDPAYNFSTDINTVADNTSVEGVTAHYLSRTRHHESGGNDNAANPLSSASGRYQFIDSTYNAYAKKLGLTGSKNDPINQELVMNAYTKDSADMLARRGIEITDANLYLMHLLGQGGGLDFLENSYDNELLTDVLPGKVYRSNQKLFTNSNGATLTVGQLKDKIQSMYN